MTYFVFVVHPVYFGNWEKVVRVLIYNSYWFHNDVTIITEWQRLFTKTKHKEQVVSMNILLDAKPPSCDDTRSFYLLHFFYY